jgi:hypothetical protein
MIKLLSRTTAIDVPSLRSDPEYLATSQVHDKIKIECDEAKVEALKRKSLENVKGYDPEKNADRIDKLSRGEQVEYEDDADNKALSIKASNRWSDLVDATEHSGRRLRDARYKASGRICQKLKAPHDEIVNRLVAGLVEAYSASVDLYKLKTDMMAEEIAFIGICSLTPHTFLGATSDPSSPLALFFREASQLGFSVPKEFRA